MLERRESAYSDAIVELIRARAAGVSTADATALGATDILRGIVGEGVRKRHGDA